MAVHKHHIRIRPDFVGLKVNMQMTLLMLFTNDRRQPNQTSLRRTLDEIGLHLNYNWLFINMSKSQLTEIIIGQKRGKITGHPPTLKVQKEPGIMKTFVSTRKFPNRSDWDQTDVAG